MQVADRMNSIPFSEIRKFFEEITRREKAGEQVIHIQRSFFRLLFLKSCVGLGWA